ncbi:hypothetical protein A2U01_0098944, partial [Trifolium medium]|nr:hypothetical protein [Trifolium medium]
MGVSVLKEFQLVRMGTLLMGCPTPNQATAAIARSEDESAQ